MLSWVRIQIGTIGIGNWYLRVPWMDVYLIVTSVLNYLILHLYRHATRCDVLVAF